jgi:hypothetical protein
MLERNMAACRLAKAGQRLKLAVGHQRCQGGTGQSIRHDQHIIEPMFHVAGTDHDAGRIEATASATVRSMPSSLTQLPSGKVFR